MQTLSLLLRYGCGETGRTRDGKKLRTFPSAGARYPLETYIVLLKQSGHIAPGAYHYRPFDHSLEVLFKNKIPDEELDKLLLMPEFKGAAAIFAFTAVFNRTENKYKNRGYRHILIEAGHIGQNIYLLSATAKIKCCAIGGVRDEYWEQLLDIDGVYESLVYCIAVGT
jgi:SagB-type dehydrogenase family enzyme